MPIPIINDCIKHVGVTTLRRMSATALRELKELHVILADEEPVAVLMPYAMYLELQSILWPTSLLPDWQTSPALNLETALETEHGKVAQWAEGADYRSDPATRLNPPSEECNGEMPTRESVFESIRRKDPSMSVTDPVPIFQTIAQEPVCAHCGQPNDTPLCTSCFMEGHRGGNCLKCEEGKESL